MCDDIVQAIQQAQKDMRKRDIKDQYPAPVFWMSPAEFERYKNGDPGIYQNILPPYEPLTPEEITEATQRQEGEASTD